MVIVGVLSFSLRAKGLPSWLVWWAGQDLDLRPSPVSSSWLCKGDILTKLDDRPVSKSRLRATLHPYDKKVMLTQV